jgi:hypothetical protein
MTIRVHPAGDEFNSLVSCAARYALGRRTYVVPEIISIIDRRMAYLQSKTLYVLARDIRDATKYEDPLMVRLGWIGLLERIETELERRKFQK